MSAIPAASFASEQPDRPPEASRTVTSPRRPGKSSAERKRLQRVRDAAPILFETADWRQFCDAATLPQKAGCQPHEIIPLVLREIVDNALDAGAHVTISRGPSDDRSFLIEDDGPGIAPDDVPRIFAVNRPLLTSKLRRVATRGLLGNGARVIMGSVAASNGQIVISTRGHRLELKVDPISGQTAVIDDDTVQMAPGAAVLISFGDQMEMPAHDVTALARKAIALAEHGTPYTGKTSPHWYGPRDFHKLMQSATPHTITVAELLRGLEFPKSTDRRPARALSEAEATTVLETARAERRPVKPDALGRLGRDAFDHGGYAILSGEVAVRGARIPFIIESWASCERLLKSEYGYAPSATVLLNRTPTIVSIDVGRLDDCIVLRGCGAQVYAPAKHGNYKIALSIIVPHIDLSGDGKAPVLTPYSVAIRDTIAKACRQAWTAAPPQAREASDKPTLKSRSARITLKDAANRIMVAAYEKASGGYQYPARARQIYYAARALILKITGGTKLDSDYFTQTLLAGFMEEHPDETADWCVHFDARGNFREPHGSHAVELGTKAVRTYLDSRPGDKFGNVLVLEKKGFEELIQSAGIAERFDVGVMSLEGISTVAARLLLDELAPRLHKVVILHDFDVSGFSIYGTLTTDGPRYKFKNRIDAVDLGLRLKDVEAMGLESERVAHPRGKWAARAATLKRHGATEREISFLSTARVELNAMTSDVFVRFIEDGLTSAGVRKVVPGINVLEPLIRDVLAEQLEAKDEIEPLRQEIDELQEEIDELDRKIQAIRKDARARADDVPLPDDLREQFVAELADFPPHGWEHILPDIASRIGVERT
jgi:hypothetical protein